VDTTTLLFATVPSSADSAISTDIHAKFVKCSVDEEEASSSGSSSPAYKVPKLGDGLAMTVASLVQPGTTQLLYFSLMKNQLHLF